MSSVVSRSAAAILRIIVVAMMGIILCAAWNPGTACARPVVSVLPQPYIMNRGDGDTINGRYYIHDESADGDALSPPQKISPSGYNASALTKDATKRIKALRWIILYHLIK